MDLTIEMYDSTFLYPKSFVNDDELHLFFSLWNNTNAKIIFKGVIAFCFNYVHCDVIGMKMSDEKSGFFQSALGYEYEKIPQDHGFCCYELLDLYDNACISVVAKNYQFLTNIVLPE